MNRRPFVRQVLGDALAPLRTGDMVLFEPADRKRWDGMYALKDGSIFMAQTVATGIRLFRPNPVYGEFIVSRDEFNASVCGWKIAEFRFDGLGRGEIERMFRIGWDLDLGTVEAIPTTRLLEAAPRALNAA